MRKLTQTEKASIVSNCEEITMAVKILVAFMEDAEIETYTSFQYEVEGELYNLTFSKPSNKIESLSEEIEALRKISIKQSVEIKEQSEDDRFLLIVLGSLLAVSLIFNIIF